MAIQTEPTRIQIPFADSGTKNVIPDTNSTPSASQAASWTDGFPAQCSLPLSAGGIPPARADFNGILNTMTQSIRYGQEGGVWAWDATVDYAANRVVLGSDGILYWSVAQSGPNLGGAQNPTTDNGTYWKSPYIKTVDAADSSDAAASTAWVASYIAKIYGTNNFYVDATNGDDSNPGTSGAPFKSLTKVESVLSQNPPEHLFVGSVNIYVAGGDYSGQTIRGKLGYSCVYYCTSGTAIVRGIYVLGSGNSVELHGSWTVNSYYGPGAVTATRSGYLNFANGSSVTFDAAIGNHNLISALDAGCIAQTSGSLVEFIFPSSTATFKVGVSSTYNSLIHLSNVTWTNSFTGKRYEVAAGSVLGGIGSPTAIPGSTAGSTDSSSYFD